MPKIDKLYTLEITVEQFLNACSYQELQEISLMLNSEMKRRQRDQMRPQRLSDISDLPHDE